MMETHRRTLAKTISWRIIAAIVTGVLSGVVTGSAATGLALGLADTLIKFVLYYGHERAWTHVRAGYEAPVARLAGPEPNIVERGHSTH